MVDECFDKIYNMLLHIISYDKAFTVESFSFDGSRIELKGDNAQVTLTPSELDEILDGEPIIAYDINEERGVVIELWEE